MVNNLQKRLGLSFIAVLIAAVVALSGCTPPQPDAPSVAEPSSQAQEEQSSESSAPQAAQQAAAAPSARRDSDENNAAYLKTYFDIELTGETTQKAFADALVKLQPSGAALELASSESPLTLLDAVKFAVAGANLEELALVYTGEKPAAALAAAEVTGADEAYAPYLACALDAGLIRPELAQAAAGGGAADKVAVDSLLMAVANHNGTSRNFLGYSDEPTIYGEIINNWEALELFDDETLSSIGVELVTQQITTGFNLKSSHYDARFLPELTIRYGHSDIKHAQQLVGLLQSEGIVARIQFEPKISIYQYLPEWGEPSDPTPTYMVRTINDQLMLAYATEYDLVLEFSSASDMQKLDGLVLEYAKKNTGEEGKNLLYASWWQPLYYAHVAMGEGYHEICDNVITNGVYSLHPFSLAENREDVLAQLRAINSTVDIQQVSIWCDAPFYRYLNGESE